MRLIAKSEFMKTYALAKGERMTVPPGTISALPFTCALKPDGAKAPEGQGDAPSIMMLCDTTGLGMKVLIQVSLNTMMPAIVEIIRMEMRRIGHEATLAKFGQVMGKTPEPKEGNDGNKDE